MGETKRPRGWRALLMRSRADPSLKPRSAPRPRAEREVPPVPPLPPARQDRDRDS